MLWSSLYTLNHSNIQICHCGTIWRCVESVFSECSRLTESRADVPAVCAAGRSGWQGRTMKMELLLSHLKHRGGAGASSAAAVLLRSHTFTVCLPPHHLHHLCPSDEQQVWHHHHSLTQSMSRDLYLHPINSANKTQYNKNWAEIICC